MFNFSIFFEYFVSFLMAFSISFVISPIVLSYLKKLNFGQEIRKEGPKNHLSKSGTPTMGGIVFIISIIITTIIANRFHFFSNIIYLLYLLVFGLVGFADDYVKVINKRNLGLTEKQKILIQIVFALALSYISLVKSNYDTSLVIPFTSYRWNIGIFYIPLTIITIIATVNSVNLTDGLDGLASSVTSIVMLGFSCIAINFSNFSGAIFALAVSGACLGFLRINMYPAKSFMGDTGSMALGGAVSAIAISMNMHFIIILIGLIYVIESVSVIIQVSFYKKYKKRIFKMSPFHHHLELSGFKETQVVKLFCVISCIMAIISLIATSFI